MFNSYHCGGGQRLQLRTLKQKSTICKALNICLHI